MILAAPLCRIVILLGYVLRSLAEIMDSSLSAELTYEDFLFDVLKRNGDITNIIETQLLYAKVRRSLNVKLVKELETTMNQLELRVLTPTNSSKTSVRCEKVKSDESKMSELREKVTRLEIQRTNISDDPHYVRPGISPFFVGLTKELEN